MKNALVLKGVNFSTNKLDTISFIEPIPCSSLSLSSNSINFTSLTTETLVATRLPSNTTDDVEWLSSDVSVVTVVDGVVTAVGIGNATITAVCGTKTATCTVSVSVTLSGNSFETLLHRVDSGTDLANGKDYVGTYALEDVSYEKYIIYLGATETDYVALTGNNPLYAAKYPIIIPRNATKIILEATGLSKISPTYLNSHAQPTYSISNKGTRVVNKPATSNATNNKVTLTIPTGVTGLDSFIFTATFGSSVQADPGLTVTFSAT